MSAMIAVDWWKKSLGKHEDEIGISRHLGFTGGEKKQFEQADGETG